MLVIELPILFLHLHFHIMLFFSALPECFIMCDRAAFLFKNSSRFVQLKMSFFPSIFKAILTRLDTFTFYRYRSTVFSTLLFLLRICHEYWGYFEYDATASKIFLFISAIEDDISKCHSLWIYPAKVWQNFFENVKVCFLKHFGHF